ncbi:hypothetical protein DAPPUDRAFT_301984 [Daphnia pulex]|uniref:Methyltransferase FkbM domain-containing protein n=1 Tax=Daphnia pulex TaxID=6669 RepID=E9HKV8_DAPPU|nr:hypothetical protein DAPPUDRAFT_301984 [Daphnia pulex]|eukprot:EFX67629.1 hypothetical protein DAPPUDRAFT_301984 [Daphnia pulex]
MRRSTFAKGRPVALMTVLSVGFTLFFFRYCYLESSELNISNYISQFFLASICDIDYINSAKSALEQDDPCILRIIREKFLFPPSQNRLHLYDQRNHNPSQGQADVILDVLKHQKNGFFVECGALDGEQRSNTLYMELDLEWQGVLIEGDLKNYKKVLKKNRRVWTVPACLSTSPYPKTVVFNQALNLGRMSQNETIDEKREESVLVQCFPFFSILSALDRTQIDYFSLDIEGDEFTVLKTIPWDRVDIKTLSVEIAHDREDKKTIRAYMEQKGYDIVAPYPEEGDTVGNDFIFKKRQ